MYLCHSLLYRVARRSRNWAVYSGCVILSGEITAEDVRLFSVITSAEMESGVVGDGTHNFICALAG